MGVPILRGPAEKTDAQTLAAGSVRGSHVAPNAVGDLQIAPEAVTERALAPGSVTSNAIGNDAIEQVHIAPDAVGEAELAAVSIEADKFIRSSNYVAGESGWAIDGDGTAEFGSVLVRGTLVGSVVDGSAIVGSSITAGPSSGGGGSENFGSTSVGSLPAGWQVSFSSEGWGTIQVVDAPGADGDKRLQLSNDHLEQGEVTRVVWTGMDDLINSDVLVKVRITQYDHDSGSLDFQGPQVFLRYSTASAHYAAMLEGSGHLAINKPISTGFYQRLSRGQVLSGWPLDTDIMVRFQVVGSSLVARAWLASETEPEVWHAVAEDSSFTGGDAGVGVRSSNVVAHTVEYDSVVVTNLSGALNIAVDGTLYVGDSDPNDAPFLVTPAGDVRVDLLQLGRTGAAHIGMDSDAIQAYDAAGSPTTLFLNPAGGRVDAPGGFTAGPAGEFTVASDGDVSAVGGGSALARGEVAYAEVTSSQGSIDNTVVDVTDLSLTFDVVQGRRYKITFYCAALQGTANEVFQVRITDGSNTRLQGANAITSPTGQFVEVIRPFKAASTGSITRKARVSRVSGSNNGTLVATSELPMFLLVEDCGIATT